jgi:hypothetical protein
LTSGWGRETQRRDPREAFDAISVFPVEQL